MGFCETVGFIVITLWAVVGAAVMAECLIVGTAAIRDQFRRGEFSAKILGMEGRK